MTRWHRNHIEQDETIITLLCDHKFQEIAENSIRQFRNELVDYIAKFPEFKTSHTPLNPISGASLKIQEMHEVTSCVGVGPMACVAGLFSQLVLESVIEAGAEEAVVDNGGDIALMIKSPVLVGVYTGKESTQNLAFRIPATRKPLGICTSSGTVGHSFSYGKADAAIVISVNIPLADAAATALGNKVKNKADLENCFEFLNPLSEIQGAMVILGDQIAMWGDLPELVNMRVDEKLITKGFRKKLYSN